MPEIYVVVSLAFAVFAAVSAVGSAIVLGIGYERLRAGLERVKEGLDIVGRQTGFFSTELHKLEQRLDENERPTPRKTATKGRAKKTKLPQKVVSEPLTTDSGSISIPMGFAPSNDWKVYQPLSREEAMANFSKLGSDTDSKIRFMS